MSQIEGTNYASLHSFFVDDASPPEPYTLSLHDALPISARAPRSPRRPRRPLNRSPATRPERWARRPARAEIGKHTSELQSHVNLVCRLLLEKKKKKKQKYTQET